MDVKFDKGDSETSEEHASVTVCEESSDATFVKLPVLSIPVTTLKKK